MNHNTSDIKLMVDQIEDVTANIRYYRSMKLKAESDLRSLKERKVDVIKSLYFDSRMKQTEIAKLFNMRQGNVSRIISEQIGVKLR